MNSLSCCRNTSNFVEIAWPLTVNGEDSVPLDPDEMFSLAVRYEFGGAGVTMNLERAIQLYQQSADRGCREAMYNLGVHYELGKGVPQNFERAVQLYRQSADRGCPDAMFNLGVSYAHGRGVEKNLEVAVEYYKKAADSDFPDAISRL